MALVVKRAGILELHRTKKIRKTALGRLPLLGHCSNISLKHNPSFSMKKKTKTYLLSLELLPKEQPSGFLHI